jgi:hypothetical protein
MPIKPNIRYSHGRSGFGPFCFKGTLLQLVAITQILETSSQTIYGHQITITKSFFVGTFYSYASLIGICQFLIHERCLVPEIKLLRCRVPKIEL